MLLSVRFELMKSRVRSVNADKDALREKLKINWELVESLQERMIGVFRDKEAWKKRLDKLRTRNTIFTSMSFFNTKKLLVFIEKQHNQSENVKKLEGLA